MSHGLTRSVLRRADGSAASGDRRGANVGDEQREADGRTCQRVGVNGVMAFIVMTAAYLTCTKCAALLAWAFGR